MQKVGVFLAGLLESIARTPPDQITSLMFNLSPMWKLKIMRGLDSTTIWGPDSTSQQAFAFLYD